ncbi:MAG: hypothetical protein ACM3JD_02665 [Rudaea sp.]
MTTAIEYRQALDMERGLLNFEFDLPLEPLANGAANPFYVDRPGNPFRQLEESLLAPYFRPPKYFFSGHRGCGKSTELRRLAVHPGIAARYYPVHFTIRDEADVTHLDFKDLLLAIGGRLYRDYTTRSRRLPPQIERELEEWRGRMQVEIERSSRKTDIEVSGGLTAFFAQVGLKMKIEPATREVVRQVIERDVTGLVAVINKISAAIQAYEKRMPLILVDDLDKPDLPIAKDIFYGHRETMLQPNCAIIYTVSSPLFYSTEFEAIRDRAIFLPNVKLHGQGDRRPDRKGYATMREFVTRRLHSALIAPHALNHAISVSGGVFREMARVMRASLLNALHGDRVELEHVRAAENEIRGEYRRMLTVEQRELLKQVHATSRLDQPTQAAPLLQILAILEYADAEPWWDVHPTIASLIGDYGNDPALDEAADAAGARTNVDTRRSASRRVEHGHPLAPALDPDRHREPRSANPGAVGAPKMDPGRRSTRGNGATRRD